MLDTPAVQSPRPGTIMVEGQPARTVSLDNTSRDYGVEHRVDPRRWGANPRHALTVGLQTTPFQAPTDDRSVGVIVLRVTVEPLPSSPLRAFPLVPLPLLLLVLLTIKRPLRLTVTWRDGAGREVRRDSVLLDLPPVLAPGTVYCGVTVCPVESVAELAPVPGEDNTFPRLYPDTPGRYRVELEVSGDVTARETVEVEVSGP